MRCLCCGKEIRETAGSEEIKTGWHKKCVRSFFGVDRLPVLDITNDSLEHLAGLAVNKGLTVPGVQKKLSLHLSVEKETRLTIVDYPTGYILKPQSESYIHLPEYEDLAMRQAKASGIDTVPHALLKLDGTYAYITKRIDRKVCGDNVEMYAMEDFCQLAGRMTQDKYRSSYESCGRIIKRFSKRPMLDLSELFIRVLFFFLSGNSDMHLKNFSLIETEPGGREYVLSQAYDLLPVNLILQEDEEELALSLNGKKKNIRRKDILQFAQSCEMTAGTAERIIKKMCAMEKKWMELCDASYLSEDEKDAMKQLIKERIVRIS
ncbi:MAG: HipA domain-containing protein [Eubacteriales bacterium]|nr:HipA domain-containing protein [Eubacteriales bacterium]